MKFFKQPEFIFYYFLLGLFLLQNTSFAETNKCDSCIQQFDKNDNIDTVRLKNYQETIICLQKFDCYDSIPSFLEQAFRIGSKTKINSLNARTWYLRGKFLLNKSDYVNATESFTQANKLYESEKMTREIGLVNMQFGLLLYSQGNFEAAIPYFEKCIELLKKSKDTLQIITAQYLTGLSYTNLKQYDKADKILNVELQACEKLKFERRAMECRMGLADLYSKTNKLDLAFTYAKTSLKYFESINEKDGIAKSKICIARIKLAYGDTQSAEDVLNEARLIIKQLTNIKIGIDVLEPLIEIYKSKNDYKNALQLNELLNALKDSVNNRDNNRAINNLHNSLNLQKQKSENELMKKENELINRKNEYKNIVLIGLIVFVLLLLILSRVWYQKSQLRKETNKQLDALLHNILPQEVATELKEKGSVQAKQFENVTVMFTDFKNFTQISEQLSATDLVNEIHNCYSNFDRIILKNGIEKIKTIGDSYMCAGGIPVVSETHAINVVSAALEIQEFIIDYFKTSQLGKLGGAVRIGIHSGPVVAGVVGINKFAYDIWGDTVNIAARMESSGEEGKINISGSTFKLIKDQFKCMARGKIKAKNKGEIEMYFVEAKLT